MFVSYVDVLWVILAQERNFSKNNIVFHIYIDIDLIVNTPTQNKKLCEEYNTLTHDTVSLELYLRWVFPTLLPDKVVCPRYFNLAAELCLRRELLVLQNFVNGHLHNEK